MAQTGREVATQIATTIPPRTGAQPAPPPSPVQTRGNRDQRKVNKGRADTAKKKIQDAKDGIEAVKRDNPIMTPGAKAEIERLKRIINKEQDRMRKSETHGRRGKGT
jgi:hypothetical protein